VTGTGTTTFPVTDAALEDLRARVRTTRWGPTWPGASWDLGTDESTLRDLAAHWADGFDWRAAERDVLSRPGCEVDLDGVPVHVDVFAAESPEALPLILTNGWPSTSLELRPLARRLARPSQHGGRSADAFTVVIPSLPGFPFSPQRPEPDSRIHELWHRIMAELGFDRYGAHGGDLGAGITSRLAEAHPEAVVGIHLLSVAAPARLASTPSPDEEAHLARVTRWNEIEGSYQHQQQQRPLTLAPALSDSPVGLLSWILEKHRNWSDCDGNVFRRFDRDYLLTVASLYWFENCISTSFRPYAEFASGMTPRVSRVEVPTAVAVFPRDLAGPPREWAERVYNVTRYSRMPRGGHFAPHEEPELLAADITAFFRDLR